MSKGGAGYGRSNGATANDVGTRRTVGRGYWVGGRGCGVHRTDPAGASSARRARQAFPTVGFSDPSAFGAPSFVVVVLRACGCGHLVDVRFVAGGMCRSSRN